MARSEVSPLPAVIGYEEEHGTDLSKVPIDRNMQAQLLKVSEVCSEAVKNSGLMYVYLADSKTWLKTPYSSYQLRMFMRKYGKNTRHSWVNHRDGTCTFYTEVIDQSEKYYVINLSHEHKGSSKFSQRVYSSKKKRSHPTGMDVLDTAQASMLVRGWQLLCIYTKLNLDYRTNVHRFERPPADGSKHYLRYMDTLTANRAQLEICFSETPFDMKETRLGKLYGYGDRWFTNTEAEAIAYCVWTLNSAVFRPSHRAARSTI